jgi:hypothetical protein
MEKTAVVKEVKDLKKKDDYGNNSFIVKFDNGDEGFYRTKSEHADKFKVGEGVTYLIEEKDAKNGKKYNKISIPQPAFKPQQGGKSFGKNPLQIRLEARSMILAYVDNEYRDKIIAPDEFKVRFLELCEIYDEGFDIAVTKYGKSE